MHLYSDTTTITNLTTITITITITITSMLLFICTDIAVELYGMV